MQIISPEKIPTSFSERIHFSYFYKTQTTFSVDFKNITL